MSPARAGGIAGSRGRPIATLLLLWISITLPPHASAATVLGGGNIEGALMGDRPVGNETIELNVGQNWSGNWSFTFASTWTGEGRVWPYDVVLPMYPQIERLLQETQPGVFHVRPFDVDGPYFVFIDQNYTEAGLHVEAHPPTVFFRDDRSEAALSYEADWPVAVIWCAPDCPNLRSAILAVLSRTAAASVSAEAIRMKVNGDVADLEMRTNLSMTPSESSNALAEVRGIRSAIREYDRVAGGGPNLYDSLWRYPNDLRAPFEEHYSRKATATGPSWNETQSRLNAVEDRILRAREVGAFEAQLSQSERAIQETRAVASLGFLVAIFVAFIPIIAERLQRGARRDAILVGVATELRRNDAYLASLADNLDAAAALGTPATLNDFTPFPLDDRAYLIASTSAEARLTRWKSLHLKLFQVYDLLAALREFQTKASTLSNQAALSARQQTYTLLNNRRPSIVLTRTLIADALELLADQGIRSPLDAPTTAELPPRGPAAWWQRARHHWPIPLVLAISIVIGQIYAAPLMRYVLILSVASIAVAFVWRRSVVMSLQRGWTRMLQRLKHERLQYVRRPRPLTRSEAILLVYVTTSASLLVGVTYASYYVWRHNDPDEFVVRAITGGAISSVFTCALSLAAWMALSSRIRFVERSTRANEALTALFPLNVLTPLAFIPYLWAVLSVPITYPITVGHVIEAGFAGMLAILGSFIPALTVAYTYVVAAADADGAELRSTLNAEEVNRFGDP